MAKDLHIILCNKVAMLALQLIVNLFDNSGKMLSNHVCISLEASVTLTIRTCSNPLYFFGWLGNVDQIQKGVLVVLAYWPFIQWPFEPTVVLKKEIYSTNNPQSYSFHMSPWSDDHHSDISNRFSIPWSHNCHLQPSFPGSYKQSQLRSQQMVINSDHMMS